MRNTINCIIIDDEHGAIEILENFVKKVSWLNLKCSFSDPLEALNYFANNTVDLVFMDINMPDLNGMQLSNLIKSEQTEVIFCTAYPEHALESYELPALDYLVKPIPFERFLTAVNKYSIKHTAKEKTESVASKTRADQLFIKSGSQIHQVETDKIKLIEKDGHYIIFKLHGRELLSRMSFKQLLKLLPKEEFIQVHRSYVVAINKIEVIHKQFIEINGREIPIGDAYKDKFYERVKYIGN